MFSNKNKAREFFRNKIKEFSKLSDFTRKSNDISFHLSRLNICLPGLKIASYMALPEELSLSDFMAKHQQVTYLFPQIDKKTQAMRFVQADPHQKFTTHSLGFQQPEVGAPFPLENIDIFLVPGLAFDRLGQRLGRGLGFYDRLLSRTQALKIGIACSCQISSASLPVESHDAPMDIVCTENFVLFPLKHKGLKKINSLKRTA